MIVKGEIHSFDLSGRTGFCFGLPGARPRRSGSVILKKRDEPPAVAYANLIWFLQEEWTTCLPEMVVVEDALPLAALVRLSAGEHVAKMNYALHGILSGMAWRFGRVVTPVNMATARKHFTGSGRAGSRDETKAMVIARCHLTGLMPRSSNDDNRADAICCWDYACATHAQRSAVMAQLYLTGEKPR